MEISLPCGKEEVHLTLPESVKVIRNKPASPLNNPESAIRDQLKSPIGSKPLSEIAAGKKCLHRHQRHNKTGTKPYRLAPYT